MLGTRLELFLRSRDLPPAQFAQCAGHSRYHVLRLRLGQSLPTRRSLLVLVEAARDLAREAVTPDMLFERADDLLHSRGSRLSALHASDLAKLDAAIEGTRDAEQIASAILATDIRSEASTLHLIQIATPRIDAAPAVAAELFAAAVVMAQSLPASRVELVAALSGEALKGRANALKHLGAFQDALTDLAAAARQFAIARYCAREAGSVEYTRATVYVSMEDHAEATRAAEAAREHFERAGDRRRAAHAAILMGGIRFEQGDIDGARITFLSVRKILATLRDHDALARVWMNLGACDVRRGERKIARHWLNRASAAFRAQGNTIELLRTRWNMATYIATFSGRDRGLRALGRVERAFIALGMDADAGCVGLDMLELMAADEHASADALLSRGCAVAEIFVRVGMRMSSASALHLLRTISTPTDARNAIQRARAELREFTVACGRQRLDAADDLRIGDD